jgi:hypothetical protein
MLSWKFEGPTNAVHSVRFSAKWLEFPNFGMLRRLTLQPIESK